MGKQSEKKISANRTKIIITVLLVVTFVALAVTIWALFFRNTGPALAPDYAPQKEEEYAEPVTGDSEEKMEVSKGGEQSVWFIRRKYIFHFLIIRQT